ncbi:MAG: HYC_CC_PP family protein [Sphingobacteriaceae bacterium]
MGKKILSWVFAGLYLLSTLGLAVNVHYCGNKLAQVQFQSREIRNCCSEKAEKTAGCCKNQLVNFKIKDQHLSGGSVEMPTLVEVVLPSSLVYTKTSYLFNTEKYTFFLQKPPPNTVPREVLYSVFRI